MLYLVLMQFIVDLAPKRLREKTFYQPLLHFIADFERGIIDLPKVNCEDLEEIVVGGQGSFGVYW